MSEKVVCHDDNMWQLQPAVGRAANRKVWKDWLRSIPDYQVEVIDVAASADTNDAFVLWRASGMARLPTVRQRPATNRPFEHYGVSRLHFDDQGLISDLWTWRGATADEAEWLLTRSYKPFVFQHTDSALRRAGGLLGPQEESRIKSAALTFKDVFGAVPGADVRGLEGCLADNYVCQEATGVWRSLNLRDRDATIAHCFKRQQEVAGHPFWHSEALTPDGKLMFVHFQNVLTSRSSNTLTGLLSGILVHVLDDEQKIERTLMFRGPQSMSERSEFFNMDCRACGRSQAETLGVSEYPLSQVL